MAFAYRVIICPQHAGEEVIEDSLTKLSAAGFTLVHCYATERSHVFVFSRPQG